MTQEMCKNVLLCASIFKDYTFKPPAYEHQHNLYLALNVSFAYLFRPHGIVALLL